MEGQGDKNVTPPVPNRVKEQEMFAFWTIYDMQHQKIKTDALGINVQQKSKSISSPEQNHFAGFL